VRKVIIVDGVDSSGKTTICKMFSKCHNWEYISTPSGDLKNKLKELDMKRNQMTGFICLLLSVFETSDKIKESKSNIICDRYYPTLFSYSEALKFNNEFINLDKLPIVKNNLFVHLYVDYRTIKNRLLNKKERTYDEELILKDKSFYDSLVKSYRKICDVEIDATNLNEKEVLNRLYSLVSDITPMEIVLLAGNNINNKRWIEIIKEDLESYFESSEILYYDHWKNGGTINIDKEVDKLTEKCLSKKNLVILAKSVGSTIVIKAIMDGKISPKKCIFIGLPVLWARDMNINLDTWIKGFSARTLFIQNDMDPVMGFFDLKKYLEKNAVINYEIIRLEGQTHNYDNLGKLKKETLDFLEIK